MSSFEEERARRAKEFGNRCPNCGCVVDDAGIRFGRLYHPTGFGSGMYECDCDECDPDPIDWSALPRLDQGPDN